ncbi:hypothetical protein Tco_1364013, partial [Tanacetum coccineum]
MAGGLRLVDGKGLVVCGSIVVVGSLAGVGGGGRHGIFADMGFLLKYLGHESCSSQLRVRICSTARRNLLNCSPESAQLLSENMLMFIGICRCSPESAYARRRCSPESAAV